MNDPYTQTQVSIDRLITAWTKYGKLIVGFDIDDTIFDYHSKGHKYPKVIKQLQELKDLGCVLIAFTSRVDVEESKELVQEILGFEIYGCNCHYEGIPQEMRGVKPLFNVMYDDKAGLGQVVQIMHWVIDKIKK